MKKTLYTAIASVLLLSSLTAVAAAASSGLIGKKVQGLMSVELNGKPVKDAIIIDGTTYAPVRSLSDAAGFNLAIEGGKVKVTTEKALVSEAGIEESDAAIREKIYQLGESIKTNTENIKIAQNGSIADYKKKIEMEKAYTTDVEAHKLMIDGLQKNLDDQLAYVADLQSKIDAANVEITSLQAQLK